jgi:hypothetical protein
MASIKGFKLKGIKTPLGREGYGCLATMYLNGKKIGAYNDYGDGSFGNEDFSSREAEEAVIKIAVDYAKEHPSKEFVKFYTSSKDIYKKAVEHFKRKYPYVSSEDITENTVYADTEFLVNEFLFLHSMEKIFKRNQKKGYGATAFSGEYAFPFPVGFTKEDIEKEMKLRNEKIDFLFFTLEDFDI